MLRLTRVSRGSARTIGAGLAVVLVLGMLAGGLHHHVARSGDDGCAICTLSHTAADAPKVVAVPVTSPIVVERVVVARTNRPLGVTLRTASTRAPPVS
jgi:hypothetical protein